MVGAFPPPVHGMAAVNAAVRKRLVEAGAQPVVIDVSARSLERSLLARLRRLPRVLKGLAKVVLTRRLRGGTLYMSVSGGLGQMYEVFFVIVARLHQMRLYLHHHSFAYLDRPSYLTRALTLVAGSTSVHITQSTGMTARLCTQYPAVRRSIPISNAVLLVAGRTQKASTRPALQTIGFISNISAEKGIFEFLGLVEAYEAEELQVSAKVAGPFQDNPTERQVRQRIADLRTVEYVGPQYDDGKSSYFDSIDALIFPTLYSNETEGIVNHEAMSHGLPVIAYGRGCIPEIIGADCGLVIDPAFPFASAALAQIRTWLDSPELYRSASRAAEERFATTLARNARRWDELLREILGTGTDVADSVSASKE